jgi:hypothetical protein
MNTYASVALGQQSGSAVRRRPLAGIAGGALVAVAILLGACGSPAAEPDSAQTPTPAASEPTGQPGSPAPEPPDAETGGGEGEGSGGNPGSDPPPLQIEVSTSLPTASYPCHPAGTIMVSGGNGGDSTQVGDSPEYPVDVTYQWFIRKAGPDAGAPVPFGLPGTLQFNVAGGIPVSAPELKPAPAIEVELRVVSPETISGGWVAHPGCA